MTRRKLQRWRWSAHTVETRPMDVAGELVAATANEALELVARDQGCAGLLGFFFWHTGGHANARNSAGVELQIVVVCFGPAIAKDGERLSRKPTEDVCPACEGSPSRFAPDGCPACGGEG